MDFDRSLLFSYLEEDNIQRAYFRVRPLLTLQGDVRQEAASLWPNEGCLRIVPDRNEQHTFKVRMRTLGSWCVVDLRGQPADAGKIRTNKNFRPDRGEVNQFILYSDTVHALPEHSFYQIVDGEAADFINLAKSAVTPLFYIRKQDTLYGPVRKDAPNQPQTAKEASGMLYELPCPDGVTRYILCMEDDDGSETTADEARPAEPVPTMPEETEPAAEAAPAVKAPAPEQSPKEESPQTPASDPLPIAEKLDILDQNQSHDDTLKQLDKPVSGNANLLRQSSSQFTQTDAPESAAAKDGFSGTPLVPTPLRVSTPLAKNRTQEVVHTQWSVGKYEPPTANLPENTRMREVSNPVEAASTALRQAWNAAGSHDQLTDVMLSLDGVRTILERKLCSGSTVTIMQRVLRDRLQDLEVERLTALCELDRAHRDVDAYKQELLTALSSRIVRDTAELQATCREAAAQADALKAQVNALTLQRDALMAKVAELQSSTLPEAAAKLLADMQMCAPLSGVPLRISPIAGSHVPEDELVQRLMDAFSSSGVEISRNQAIVLLVLMAVSPRIGLSCATTAAASTLVQNIMTAFGWRSSYAQQFAQEQRPVVSASPVDATPAVLLTSLPNYAPLNGITKITMNRSVSALIRNAAYDVQPWPVICAPSLSFVPEIDATDGKPVSLASVLAFANKACVTDQQIEQVIMPVLNAALPVSGASRRELYRFISVCAGLLDGGLPVAVDWAITLWIVPGLERGSKHYSAVKALLDEYPIALSFL